MWEILWKYGIFGYVYFFLLKKKNIKILKFINFNSIVEVF